MRSIGWLASYFPKLTQDLLAPLVLALVVSILLFLLLRWAWNVPTWNRLDAILDELRRRKPPTD